jgi:hypothetical protein
MTNVTITRISKYDIIKIPSFADNWKTSKSVIEPEGVLMPVATEKKSISSIEPPSDDARYKLVDRALKRLHYQQDALIEVLHVAQEAFGYLATWMRVCWCMSLAS